MNLRRLLVELARATRPLDYLAIALAIAALVAVSAFAASGAGDAGSVEIESAGETYLYEIESDHDIHVEGPLGSTHIEIRDGRARVVSSPCREKICVAAGWLEQGGEWAACLPNQVFLTLRAERTDDLDALSF